jgi:hypothetical protein
VRGTTASAPTYAFMMPTGPADSTVAHPDPFDQLGGAVPGGYGGQLWWPAPGLMVSRVLGHLDTAAARFLAASIVARAP